MLDAPSAETSLPDIESLYREYGPRIQRLARRLLGNATDAEDLLQDVFLQVQRKLSTFRGEAAPATWLYRLAVNATLAYRRQRATRDRDRIREGDIDDLLEGGTHLRSWQPGTTDPQQQTLEHERESLVDEAVSRLPEEQRDVVVLADLEELPLSAVAELLDLSIAAVKSRLHRAREHLRQRLAPQFEARDGGSASGAMQ